MLDFGRTSFNKAIKLTPDKRIEIESKYPLGKLGAVADVPIMHIYITKPIEKLTLLL